MRYLYLMVALLALAVVGLNDYTARTLLSTEDAIAQSNLVTVVCARQSDEIEFLDGQVKKASGMINALRNEIAKATTIIENTGETIKELTDENSELKIKLEHMEVTIDELKNITLSLNQKKLELEKQVEELKKQLKEFDLHLTVEVAS